MYDDANFLICFPYIYTKIALVLSIYISSRICALILMHQYILMEFKYQT